MADKVDFTINSNMHSAFLREVDRLQKAVATVDLSDSAVAAGLARRYVFFSHTLHAHHEGEDTFLWPLALAKATPQEAVILNAMAAEHEALATALTGLDSQFAQLSADSDVARISGGLDRLRAILTGHCAHEERDAVPVVQKYVTREDLKSFMAFTGNNRTRPWCWHGCATGPPPRRSTPRGPCCPGSCGCSSSP